MKEHETQSPYDIALDYDDAFARSPVPAPASRSDAAGYPHTWSPRTAPSVHQQWLDDQAVFMRPPRTLERDSGHYAVARTLPPKVVAKNDLGVLAVAAVIGLTLAGASAAVLWQRGAPATASRTTHTPPATEVTAQPDPPRMARAAPRLAAVVVGTSAPIASVARARTRPAPSPREKPEPAPLTASAPIASRASIASVLPDTNDDEDRRVAASAPAAAPESPEPEEPAAEEPPPVPAGPPGEFDRDAARSAMFSAAARAAGCGTANGPTGRGRVVVTVAPGGSVASVSVGPPFGGSNVGACVASAFRGVALPPFTGGSVTLHKSFDIAASKSRAAEPPAASAAPEGPAPEKASVKKRPTRKKRASKKRARRASRKHKVDLE